MERRNVMRMLAGTAFAGMQGCAMPLGGWKENAGVYEIPGRAIDHLRRRAGGGFACWQKGNLLFSEGNRGSFPVLSVTKSVAALMIARAVTKGWFRLDEAVIFPEWRGRRTVTLRQLLHSCSGLPPGDRELYSARPVDKGLAALRLRSSRLPGSAFQYGPSSWEALGEFLKRRLPEHGANLQGFLAETVSKLGIRPMDWRRDGLGTPYLSTGMVCGLNDLGRLGSVLADLASGHDRVGVSAAVFDDLTERCPANPMFSAGIWWNRNARMSGARSVEPERSLDGVKTPAFWRNACLHPAAEPEWFALVGSGGTRVYILPSESVVIAVARVGDSWSDAAMLSVC